MENRTRQEVSITLKAGWSVFGKYRDIFPDWHLPRSVSVSVCACVCVCLSVCLCLSVYVYVQARAPSEVSVLNLHVKASLIALVYMVLWFNYDVMDVVIVVVHYLVIISDATNEFLLVDNKDLLN